MCVCVCVCVCVCITDIKEAASLKDPTLQNHTRSDARGEKKRRKISMKERTGGRGRGGRERKDRERDGQN